MASDPMSVAKQFYDAFTRKDGDAMAKCYAEDVVFSDPVFPRLSGREAKGMWRMLCQRASDLRVEYVLGLAKGDTVHVRWNARYTFTKTGRPVYNQIQAKMKVHEGKITEHTDTFSFPKWAAQALGLPGRLLGWTPFFKARVRKTAANSLASYLKQF